MNINKRGIKTLGLNMILGLLSLLASDGKSEEFLIIETLIISTVMIIVWYNAIKEASQKRFINGALVSLYFTIPSTLSGVVYCTSTNSNKAIYIINDMIYASINFPLFPANYKFVFTDSITAVTQSAIPLININLILLITFVQLQANKHECNN